MLWRPGRISAFRALSWPRKHAVGKHVSQERECTIIRLQFRRTRGLIQVGFLCPWCEFFGSSGKCAFCLGGVLRLPSPPPSKRESGTRVRGRGRGVGGEGESDRLREGRPPHPHPSPPPLWSWMGESPSTAGERGAGTAPRELRHAFPRGANSFPGEALVGGYRSRFGHE